MRLSEGGLELVGGVDQAPLLFQFPRMLLTRMCQGGTPAEHWHRIPSAACQIGVQPPQ